MQYARYEHEMFFMMLCWSTGVFESRKANLSFGIPATFKPDWYQNRKTDTVDIR